MNDVDHDWVVIGSGFGGSVAALRLAEKGWSGLADWKAELAPHYETAERMLGVATVPFDQRVGIYFGAPGETVPDPYFGGKGPARTGCVRCGSCMVGCRYGAKNTLVKNYLWFAERLGVRIEPERTVVDVRPLGAAEGSQGYAITCVRSGAWLRKRQQTSRLAASSLPPERSARTCCSPTASTAGRMPRISNRLGHVVRTNSESVLAATGARRCRRTRV
jgi:cholesterol oxidase